MKKDRQSAVFFRASGGNRTRTAVSGQGIFVPLWLSPPVTVCGLDYSFTVGNDPLGVSCLVSAPSSFKRLGSRLPSALSVKVSLNLRHSTLSLSGQALKLCLSPSCLPFHHQGRIAGAQSYGKNSNGAKRRSRGGGGDSPRASGKDRRGPISRRPGRWPAEIRQGLPG